MVGTFISYQKYLNKFLTKNVCEKCPQKSQVKKKNCDMQKKEHLMHFSEIKRLAIQIFQNHLRIIL